MYPKKLDAYLCIMLANKGCVAPFDDPYRLSAEIMNIVFDLIARANRVALLLNWEDPYPFPDHYKTSMYGKRAGETNRFRVSNKALQFIYTYGAPYISGGEKPACICAPLKLSDGRVFGVIYVDKRGPGEFEIKNMECLERISGPAAKLIYRSFKQQADREEELDSYHEHLRLDELKGLGESD
jgi:hypothetical protein